jgi:DNA-binding response OmpR family regulator
MGDSLAQATIGRLSRLVPESRPSSAWRVLIVESDASEREALASRLRRHGHNIESVGTGNEAMQVYESADIILLDLELPDLDGLEVCGRIRSACHIPIIAVTARGMEVDRILGLQAGMDDYIVKPYGFRELMARMCAVMRRVHGKPKSAGAITHGPLQICPTSRSVRLDDQEIGVTTKEFDLLLLLASHPDTVVSRSQIMQQVWGGSWSRRTVDTHVSSLRSKLGENNWIITVRGVGFRLGAPDS